MSLARNDWLLAGGVASGAAALAHLAVIAGGPAWYRFFGAGERMARGAEDGRWQPAVMTLGIALVLAIWSAYAWSGAGLLPRLPLLRPALVAITAIYLLRGAVLVWPPLLRRPDLSPKFIFWSSTITLVIGLVHAIGTWQGWRNLEGAI